MKQRFERFWNERFEEKIQEVIRDYGPDSAGFAIQDRIEALENSKAEPISKEAKIAAEHLVDVIHLKHGFYTSFLLEDQ